MADEKVPTGGFDEELTADAFAEWQGARRSLDEALGAFLADRGSTRELLIRLAELRRSEEVAWAAVEERLARHGGDPRHGGGRPGG